MALPTPTHAILDRLNDAQRRAVSSDASTLAILAGPGSGKTHTLTARVVWLVDHVGFRPDDVLVATFTVKAAREMKERIGKALGEGREKKLILGTFHSIARRYLAAYGRHIGLSQKFGIADDTDSRAIIARICKRLQTGTDPAYVRAWISKKKAKGPQHPSRPAGNGTANGSRLQDLETCYREYQKHLETSNLLDYDDLLVRCVELLRKFPACVSNIQAVLIDEYQDTNGVQYDLMKLFAQRQKRITIVGDPDQSIYGWRSADIRNLERLLRDFPQTNRVALEQNYRSSESIIGLSLAVIQQDEKRYKKVLKAVHSKGCRPVLRRLKSASAEAEWIVTEIRRALFMSGSMLVHSDVAILLRSAALSRHIESALGKAGISYRMVGGFKFYDRTEIKTLLDYLRVIHQPENNDALARIINTPRRGIGDITVRGLLEEAETASLSVWAVLTKHCQGNRAAKTRITKHAEQKISGGLLRPLNDIRRKIGEASGPNGTPFGLVEMIEQLLTTLNFEKHLRDTHPDDHEQRWANVQEFISLAADFVREMDRSDDDVLPEVEGLVQTREVEALPRFLANVSLAADAQTGGDDQSKPSVTISTIHAAKGLEWPIVFIPAVYDKSIPHARSDDDDEERRLLYVAMTRAQSLLYLSSPLVGSNGERTQLSPFVDPVKRWFNVKGPCFDRPVMAEIARIVQRTLPPDESVFRELPSMFSTEDNLFPVDPEESKPETDCEWRSGENHQFTDMPRKRPRLQGSSMAQYTTMGQLSTSTAAMPGFVTVGAHQAAISAASASVEAARKAEAAQRLAAKRPADQKCITGFVKTKSEPVRPAPVRPNPNQNPLPPRNAATHNPSLPPQQAIHPSLTGHRLGAGKLMTRPVAPSEEGPTKGKHYACFSSSPPRATSPGDDNTAKKPVEGNEGVAPQPARPGGFRRTTPYVPSMGIGNAVRKPAGMAPKRITPIQKLKRPFKPLTINRP